jgi:GT2 family glycosyltransferase
MISIIIPHYNQPQSLEKCLASLISQEVAGRRVEIIVVDNGSDQLPSVIVEKFPGVILLFEPTPGPGPARNMGAKAAKGEFLAFTDADCYVDHGWLNAAAAHLTISDIVGGDVQIGHIDANRPTIWEAYESIYGYRQAEYIAREHFSATCNLAVRASVFADVGGFAGIGIAEDMDWGKRATAKGYVINYAPDMLVYHPARSSFAELRRKWDRLTGHQFNDHLLRRFGRLKWVVRTMAMLASPLWEIGHVVTSDRVKGGIRGRILAYVGLVRVRCYRFSIMSKLIFAKSGDAMAGQWRKG